VLLDAAHNPEGAAALAKVLSGARGAHASAARTALVFGALADKRWEEMLRALAPCAGRRFYTEPKGRAAAPIGEMRGVAEGEAVAAPLEALRRAVEGSRAGDTVVVTGTIFLVGEVRAALLGIEADPVIAL
jgi:dihydrofolate synthase/folylpolyglutamate synthase